MNLLLFLPLGFLLAITYTVKAEQGKPEKDPFPLPALSLMKLRDTEALQGGWAWERKWQEAEPIATDAPAVSLSLMVPHTKPSPECQDSFKNDALPFFIASLFR